MKTYYFFICFLFLLAVQSFAQDPTDAGIPDANHVLVVYNTNSDTSFMVANYYQNARNIPSSNIVRLENLVDQDITIDEVTHRVKIVQVTDMIQDSVNNANNPEIPTKHAWKYFLDNIATPIKTHLENNNLLSTIRYIVLCKGVPFKIQAARDYGGPKFQPGNLTVDGLLCMLNTPGYETTFILGPVFRISEYGGIPNPYYGVDQNYTMEYRFLPDQFTTYNWNGYDVKLSYLVSHLDGISFDVVKGIIDSSLNTDISGTAAWIIDEDPNWLGYDFTAAKNKLEELGFNVVFDNTNKWLTTYDGMVMGYTSWGTHAEDGNCEWEDSAWVKDSLHFDLANGSVFNTYESFNGNSLTTLNWRYAANIPPYCNHTQGLATQFTEIGGTATMGHAWEPNSAFIVKDSIFFPSYQIGYNLLDAYYQGLPSLAAQNVLVGDPLVRIYECDNTVISINTTIHSGEYECNVIVPLNVILTIAEGSTVNFKRNAKFLVYGKLELENDATLNFDKYSRFYLEGNLTVNGDSAFMNFNDKSVFKANNISVDNSLDITLNDNSEFYINENGVLITHPDNNFTFNEDSKFFVNGRLIVNEGNSLYFNNTSSIKVNSKIYLNAGAMVNFNDNSYMDIDGTLICLGELGNEVIFNFSEGSNSRFKIYSVDSILVDYAIFNYNGLNIFLNQANPAKLIKIINSNFESATNPLYIACRNIALENPIAISNCEINNCYGTGIRIDQVPEIILDNNIIRFESAGNNKGIVIKNNGTVEIFSCIIDGSNIGIESMVGSSDEIEIIEELATDILISQCIIEHSTTGILIDDQSAPYNSVDIYANHFNSCKYSISIDEFFDYSPNISENILSGSLDGYAEYGMVLTNGNEVVVSNNSITNFLTGISLNLVATPYILENTISALDKIVAPLSGIVAVSSCGQIRNNTIQYHRHGIELGSSSPLVGANTITDNIYYGIYISGGSNPDLSEAWIGGEKYPLSGYNTIRENGLCNQINYSEIYLNKSSVNLEKGCNTIADDREDQLSCGYYLLIDGKSFKKIKANRNYWGELNNHNPSGRFGQSLIIDYSNWQTTPCTYDQSGGLLILTNSKGVVYDTLFSTSEAPSELTDLESRYATANDYFYTNQYSQAREEYESIIENYGDSTVSLQAYDRLYTIANLLNSSSETFIQLKDFYLQKAGIQTDTLMIGSLTHLSDLCLISEEEYLSAINNFDEIVQQNPNTDLAFYRQIDALTTSLLIPQDSSSLNKGTLGKYSVYNLEEYNNKLSELIKTRGKSGLEREQELLPTEYALYQNYPNPFNPTTTIKYDLPDASDVSLIIYDILGRKVKELVSTKQAPGKYEVQFDASNLASGIYIYQLVADKYMNSKKMILIK